MHEMHSFDTKNFQQIVLKMTMDGIKNMEAQKNSFKPCRLALNPPALKVFGHILNDLEKDPHDRLVIWSAVLLGFWGAMRMGEFLSYTVNSASPNCARWSQVSWVGSDQMGFFIPIPKVSEDPRGSVRTLIKMNDSRYCPVYNLKILFNMSSTNNNSNIIFRFKSGKLLTPKYVNLLLKNLSLTMEVQPHYFSGHSLRAGLPSTMSATPGEYTERELREVGNWRSNAYDRYARAKMTSARKTFKKVEEKSFAQ